MSAARLAYHAPQFKPLTPAQLRAMLADDDAFLDLDRHAAVARRITAEDAKLLADMTVQDLRDVMADGGPAAFRLAARAEYNRRAWTCHDCGATQHDDPSDYDNRDYEDGPLCHDCARERFDNGHVRVRVGCHVIYRPFVEVPF